MDKAQLIKDHLFKIKDAINKLEDEIVKDGKMNKFYAKELDNVKRALLILEGFEIKYEDLI